MLAEGRRSVQRRSGRPVSNQASLLLAALAFAVAAPAAAAPIDDARLKGLKWLVTHQRGDGRWASASGLEVPITATAIEALRNAGIGRGDAYATGLAWLQNAEAFSTDALARQATALYRAGKDASALMTRLIAWRNNSYRSSWGAYDQFGPSFPDSPLAMEAIAATGTVYADTGYGLGFITGQQNADGGWAHTKPEVGTAASRIIPTAHAVLALNRYKASYSLQSNINNGVAWLKSQQRTGGGFGEGSTGTPLETILAYRALRTELGGSDAAVINAQNYLVANQQADGSWGSGDALLTAFALAALPAATLADTDGDGLPDGVEALLGTQAGTADSHGLGQGNGQSIVGETAPQALTGGQVSQSYTTTLPGIGTGSQSFSLVSGRLPDGLILNNSTGQVTGMPTAGGTFNFVYRVTAAGTQSDINSQITVAGGSDPGTPVAVPALPGSGLAAMAALLALTQRRRPRRKTR